MTLQGEKRKPVAVGNYKFTGRILGKGNFARVEEAVHALINIKVAIKIMDLHQIKEEYVIKNLYREAKIMSKLNHPCIAALFQTMQVSDTVYYLVTELAAGGDLCSFIKGQRYGKLDERSTKNYARQFVSALSHMHNMGIVHRDLKMENVMLNALQTQIKIVDFGLSNVWSADSPLRTHCGSPEYAAPELFVTGREYGPEVDLWSFGIILFGMIVGQLPFISNRSERISSQERRKKLVAQINRGISVRQRQMIANNSSEFKSLMNKLLVADSAKRISMKQLIVHAWITDNNTKIIRSNPVKKLDSTTKFKIYENLSTIVNLDTEELHRSSLAEPLGNTAGMYNILRHKVTTNYICGDGISKSITAPSSNRPNTVKQHAMGQNIMSSGMDNARNPPPMSAPSNRCSHLEQEQRMSAKLHNLTVRNYSSKINPARAATTNNEKERSFYNHVRPRPKTVENNLILKNALARKQAYSANLKIGNQKPCDKYGDYGVRGKSLYLSVPQNYNTKPNRSLGANEVVVIGSRKHLSNIKKLPSSSGQNVIKRVNGVVQMKNQGSEDVKYPNKQSRSKSDSTCSKRPTTTHPSNSSKYSTCMSPHPVSSSIKSTSISTPTRNVSSGVYKLNKDKSSPSSKKSALADGDNRTHQRHSQSPKSVIYDPIAKSIADYLNNNVSDKIRNIKWPKQFTNG